MAYWLSEVPTHCESGCGNAIKGKFYDAPMVRGGPWGCICPTCFLLSSPAKLGIGLGQEFTKQRDGKWLCTAGGEGEDDAKARAADRFPHP